MKHKTLLNPVLILSLLLASVTSLFITPAAKADSGVVDFFDNFESYTIGSKLADVYEYKGVMGWGDPGPAPSADLFQVGTVGSNKVFQYQWAGPSYHYPHVQELYKQVYSRVDEVGATYLYTQHSMGIEGLFFEWTGTNNFIYISAGYTNKMGVQGGSAGELGSIDLWPDKVITQMSHRIEAKRLSDTTLEASITRLDTGEKKTLTVNAPRPTTSSGYQTGFKFYEDYGGGIYVNIDDFHVKGVPMDTAPVAYWKFDENSGNVAHDFVGSHDGAIYGSTWSTGQSGSALNFDGNGDYIIIPNAPNLNPAHITIETWVKLTAPAANGGVAIVEKGGWNGGQTGYAFLVGNWGIPNSLRFEVYPSWRPVTSVTGLSLNQWYHVAATYDGSLMKIYINGELDNSLNAPGPINVGNDSVLGIGARFLHNDVNWNEISQDLNGAIDSLGIYNQALSANEIRQHYQDALATNLAASTANANIYPGDPISVDLNIQNAQNLYAAQALCEVNPSVLQLQSGEFGDFFDSTLRLVAANQTDAAAGKWLGAISQQNPAGPLSGNGLYATLNYVASAPGTTSLNCEPLFSDRDGFSLPISFAGMNITVLPFGIVNGEAHYQGRLDHTGIEVIATGSVAQTVHTDASGNLALNQLKTGNYNIKADAALYLPACFNNVAATSGQTVTLATVTLLGGDLNDDESIIIGDLTRLGAGFGTSDSGADINVDGTVNVQDLALIGGNYGISGCQAQ